MKEPISTPDAPAAIGPYSQGIKAPVGRLLFTAGQIPLDPKTGEMVTGDIQAQTRRSLTNIKAVLEAGGATLQDVVKTTVFLADMNDFTAVNQVYAEFFSGTPPARSAVAVKTLPKGAAIEIEAIAVVGA